MAASPSDNRPGSDGGSAPWWRRLLFGRGWGKPVPAAAIAPDQEPPPGVPDAVLGDEASPGTTAVTDDGPGQWYEPDIHLPADLTAETAAPTNADAATDAPAAADSTITTADEPGAPDATGGTRRLSNQATLTGRVTAGPDTPVGGAVLVVLDPTGAEVTRGHSDEDGRYQVTLPTGGTYLVAVSTEGHRPSIASVTVAADHVDRDFALSAISALGGTVRTADGHACADASVTLIDAGGDVVAVARTGPDGGYELTDLYPGEYTLTAIVPDAGTTARPVSLTGSDRLVADVDLPATGTVLGVVTRQGSDRPVADAQVAVLDAAGLPAATAVTGDDGAFRIDDLPSGTYTVVASGYAATARPVRIQAGPGEMVDLSIGHQADTAALPRGRHARTERVLDTDDAAADAGDQSTVGSR